jgi:hypothetical protein
VTAEDNVDSLSRALVETLQEHCEKHKIRDIEEVLGACVTVVAWLLAGLEPNSREVNLVRFGRSLKDAIDRHIEAGRTATIHRVAGSMPQ